MKSRILLLKSRAPQARSTAGMWNPNQILDVADEVQGTITLRPLMI